MTCRTSSSERLPADAAGRRGHSIDFE